MRDTAANLPSGSWGFGRPARAVTATCCLMSEHSVPVGVADSSHGCARYEAVERAGSKNSLRLKDAQSFVPCCCCM